MNINQITTDLLNGFGASRELSHETRQYTQARLGDSQIARDYEQEHGIAGLDMDPDCCSLSIEIRNYVAENVGMNLTDLITALKEEYKDRIDELNTVLDQAFVLGFCALDIRDHFGPSPGANPQGFDGGPN